MANRNLIKEYLVSLGFDVNQSQLRQFSHSLRTMAAEVEKFTISPYHGIAPMFLKAGGLIATALAGIDIATVGLLHSVSKTDLEMQMFARRMFMNTDAARRMKMATDALGVSLEDVVWGPPELRERYTQLIKDQERMALGGDWEGQMRHLRDFEFQFTRMHLAAQYFMMYLAGSVSRALFGDQGSLIENLNKFNESLTPEKLQHYADAVANVLVPALKLTWEILKGILQVIEYLNEHRELLKILGYTAAGGVVGSVIPGAGTATGAGLGLAFGVGKYLAGGTASADYHDLARKMATKYNLDYNRFSSLIQTESSWNPSAINPDSGAYGFGQFMPKNRYMFGMDSHDPVQNLEMTARYLRQLLDENGQNWGESLKHYGGFKTKDPSGYIDSVINGPKIHPSSYRVDDASGGILQPAAYHTTINVHVEHANANAQEISDAIARKQEAKARADSQRSQAQFAGLFT